MPNPGMYTYNHVAQREMLILNIRDECEHDHAVDSLLLDPLVEWTEDYSLYDVCAPSPSCPKRANRLNHS